MITELISEIIQVVSRAQWCGHFVMYLSLSKQVCLADHISVVEFGIVGKFIHFPSKNDPFVRIMHVFDEQHN